MTSKNFWSRLAACSALTLAAGAAQAELYNFSISGDYTASWQLNDTVIPDDYALSAFFSLWDVPGNFTGATFGFVDLTFRHPDFGGGLIIEDFWGNNTLLVANGDKLYYGFSDEGSPTFIKGTFSLTGAGSYTMTIASVPVPAPVQVPEPATLALLLGGLGVMATVAIRRRKSEAIETA